VNTWKVILATMVIFGAGVVTGGLLVRSTSLREVRPQRPAASIRPAPPTYAGVMRVEFLRRMERELDVTPEQRAQIDKLLKESQERSKEIMEPVEPQLREEIKRTRAEFIGVLTPQQRQAFEEKAKQQQHAREPHKAGAPRESSPSSGALTNVVHGTN
jgi:Spy/CpxP family protein refolding chaperone